MLRTALGFAVTLFASVAVAAPMYESELIFDPTSGEHGHVHASCIVVCPNGELRAVWYENGTPLPSPPYYNEDRDKRSDVRIGGARKPAGAAAWGAPFVMADTFGVSDNNPCMVIDREQRLWLVYPTLLGVPQWAWGSGLVRYHVATSYDQTDVPQWTTSNILVPHAVGLLDLVNARLAQWVADGRMPQEAVDRLKTRIEEAQKNPLIERLGWMPRNHPLVMSDGAVLLPLSNENFNVPCMAITRDAGATWTISSPVPEIGLLQPSVIQLKD